MSRRRASPAPAGASCSSTSRPTCCRSASLYGSIAIGWAILAEASVSFLGFGDSDSVSLGHDAAGRLSPPGAVARRISLVRAAGRLHHPRRASPASSSAAATRKSVIPEAARTMTAGPLLLEVDDLAGPLPHAGAARCARSTARLRRARGPHRRPGRRSGLRQDHARRAPSWACWPRTAAHRRRQHHLRGPGDLDTLPTRAPRAAAGATSPSCRKAR